MSVNHKRLPDDHDLLEVVDGALEDAWRKDSLLELRGWILIEGAPCERIELVRDGAVAAVAVTGRVERDDLARAFPNQPGATLGGFELSARCEPGRAGGGTLRVVSKSGTVVVRELVERLEQSSAPYPLHLGARSVEFRARAAQSIGVDAAESGALYGVSIDTTSVCNLRCTICALERDYDLQAHMSLELFSRLDDAFPTLRHLSFSLNAEPLLNKRLEDMIALSKRRSAGRITTSLATNATLLDERRLAALAEAGLDALEISIDGVRPQTYLDVRIGADFARVMGNLARAAALEAAGGRAPHVSVRWVLSRDNFAELPELLELCARIGVGHVVVNGLEPYTAEQAELTHFTSLDEDTLRESFEALELRAARLGVRVDLPQLRPSPYSNCDLIDHACVIRVDGAVAPCSPLSYSREFYFEGRPERHPLIRFGSIAERSLLEIWNDPDFVAFRRNALDGPLHEACRTCLKRAGVVCPLKHWNWLAAGAPQPQR